MKDNDKEPHPDYLKGFNEGYMMAKYMPELMKKMGNDLGSSERGMGFSDGRDEYASEKEKDKYPSWLRDGHRADNGTSPDNERSRDKGHEPDR